MNTQVTAQIAEALAVSPNQIKRCEEWASVYFVIVHGLRPRFVSKKVVKMNQVGEYTLSQSLEIREDKVFCAECNRWEYASKVEAGVKIKHSSRCDSQEQPQKEKKSAQKDCLTEAAKQHMNGQNVDSDLVFRAYQAGHLSMSAAMNSDF